MIMLCQGLFHTQTKRGILSDFLIIPTIGTAFMPILAYGIKDFKATENFSVFIYEANGYLGEKIIDYEIYDYFDEKLLFSKIQGTLPYLYDKRKGRLRFENFILDENFDPKSLDKHLAFKMIDDYAYVGENSKPIRPSKNIRHIEKIFELDNNNLLIINDNMFYDKIRPYKYCLRFSNKEKKFYDIDTSEFPNKALSRSEFSQLIQLKGNKFLHIKIKRRNATLSY